MKGCVLAFTTRDCYSLPWPRFSLCANLGQGFPFPERHREDCSGPENSQSSSVHVPQPHPEWHGGSGQESLWGRMGILTAKAVLSLAHHSQWQAEVLSSPASAGRVVGARIWLGR